MEKQFAFISYSHADKNIVESLVHLFKMNGIGYWYDKQLKAGDDWEKEINEKIELSRAFIVILSRTSETRYELIRELELAVKKKEQMSAYPIIAILVERVPLHVYPEKVRKCLERTQYVGLWECGGITKKFANELFSNSAFPEEIVDYEWRNKNNLPAWNTGKINKVNLLGQLKNENTYIYPYVVREACEVQCKDKKLDIYKLNPGETAPGAVYPLIMDNQWYPPEYYENPDLNTLKPLIQERKKQEIFRALLHTWQMIVNRAYLVNSDVFSQWYTDSGDDYKTFQNFINNGTIVLYLYREDTPIDNLDFERAEAEAWEKFCLKNKVYCLKMDWDDKDINKKETGYYLQYKFHHFCAMLTENDYLVENIENALGLQESDSQKLKGVLRKIQRYAIAEQKKAGNGTTREKIYKKFVLKKKTKVVKCVIDKKKPFACEIKQLVDLRYNKNLADALGIYLLVPEDARIQNDVLEEPMAIDLKKEISSDVFLFAMETFSMYDMENEVIPEYVFVPLNARLTLKDIELLRQTAGWEDYVNAVEASHKRVESGIFSYEDILTIWRSYYEWLGNVRNIPGLDIEWEKRKSAVSIIYNLGNTHITTVYEKGMKRPKYRIDSEAATNGKAKIMIDFVCQDVMGNVDTNCMMSQICFFTGVSKGAGDSFVEDVKESLRIKGSV